MKFPDKRTARYFWFTVALAPVLLAGIVLGLWLSVSAAFESVRFARATDQILEVVGVARYLASDATLTDRLATTSLYERVGAPARSLNGSNQRYLLNPWDDSVTLEMLPSTQSVRIEDRVPPAVCRQMISFFAKDTRSLGLLRVDVLEGAFTPTWHPLFDVRAQAGEQHLEASSVESICGTDDRVVLAMTFSLK